MAKAGGTNDAGRLSWWLRWGSAIVAIVLAVAFLSLIASSSDKASALGNVLGGFAAGSLAVWLWWLQADQERAKDARADAAFIRALYLDIHSTIRMIDWSLGEWTKPDRINSLDEMTFLVEPLRPLLFEANLERIERLDRRQAGFALLGHANLRIACESIQKLGELFARRDDNAVPIEVARAKKQMAILLNDISVTLTSARGQLSTALSALDPTGDIAREFELPASEKTKIGG